MTDAVSAGGDPPQVVPRAVDGTPPEVVWEESMLQDSPWPVVIALTMASMTTLLVVVGDLDLGNPAGLFIVAIIGLLFAFAWLDARGRRALPLEVGTLPDSFHFRYRSRVETIAMKDVRSVKRGFVSMKGPGADFTMADGRERHVAGIHWYQVDHLEAALRLFQRRQEALRREDAALEGKRMAEEVEWQSIRLSGATRSTALFVAMLAGAAGVWGVWSVLRWGSLPIGSILVALFLGVLAWGLRRQARRVPHAFSVTQGALRLDLPGGQEVIPVAEIKAIRKIQMYRNQGSLEVERVDGRKQQFLSIQRGKLEEIVGAVEMARGRGEGAGEAAVAGG